MHVHRPLVRLRHPPEAPAQDWTSAVDSALCRRLQTCTQCGTAGQAGDTVVVVQVRARGIAVATIQCKACQRQDPTMTALIAQMERRYAKEMT